MKEQVQLWSLDEESEHEVLFNNKCCYCGSKISNRIVNAEGATYICDHCDVTFYYE